MLFLSVVAAVVEFFPVSVHSNTFELLLHLDHVDTNTVSTHSFLCYCFVRYHFGREGSAGCDSG